MAEVLGMEIPDLPEGWQPVEAIVIVKCLRPPVEDAEDNFAYGLASRLTDGMSTWEAAGMAEWAKRNAFEQLMGGEDE